MFQSRVLILVNWSDLRVLPCERTRLRNQRNAFPYIFLTFPKTLLRPYPTPLLPSSFPFFLSSLSLSLVLPRPDQPWKKTLYAKPMPTRSGKEYQLPAAEMASEMAAVAEVQQHEPALNHILSTSTSSSSNLSSLTPLPSDDVGQLHHLPGHLSLSTRTADDLVDQTLSVEGMLSGLSNSPETRVEENSLDCQEVEKALISSPSQWVEVDLP